MEYTGLEFMRLTEEIEDQGGIHLNVLHERRTIKIPKQREGGEAQRIRNVGCRDAAMFSIPFEKGVFGGDVHTDQVVSLDVHEDAVANDGEGKGDMAYMAMPIDERSDSLVVCAKDDCVGLWPRFAGSWEEEE